MKYVTVEELELLSFFEVEPTRSDPEIPWPYNDFLYRVELGEYSISFSVAPAYRDFSLSVTHRGSALYTATALSVEDIRYHKDGRVETLEIVISDRDKLWLRLRPSLLITQDAREV